MNDSTDNKLKALKDLNTSIKEFNTHLEELVQSRKKDKLKYLQDLNAQVKEMNTLLTDLLESRKKDAITYKLHQTTQ